MFGRSEGFIMGTSPATKKVLAHAFILLATFAFAGHISEAQTVTLDFSSATGGCVDASTYLNSFNISFMAISSGATAQICGPSAPAIPTGYFFIGPPVTNTPVSGELDFSTPASQITITTVDVDPRTSVPAWDVLAYDAAGNLLISISEPALFPGHAVSVPLNVSEVTRLHFDAFNTGGQTYNFPPISQITLMGGCPLNPGDVKPYPAGPYSLDGKPTSMNATFVPTDTNNLPIGLAQKAAACGFSSFNWQQVITLQSALEGIKPTDSQAAIGNGIQSGNLSANGSLQAPPAYSDPPLGGYIYEGYFDDAYPFYFNSGDLAGLDPCTNTIPIKTSFTLLFDDCPSTIVEKDFTTDLVGVLPSGLSSASLFNWKWHTTFNGKNRGGVVQNKSILPLIPSSGTGGVTITGINGVPQTPPFVSCAVVGPNRSGPPQGPYEVEIFGRVAPGTQPLAAGGTTYAVVDDYGNVESSGSFTPNGDGSYSFEVSRKEVVGGPNNFQLDPTLTIVVNATDKIGNVGSCSILVGALQNRGH
jgi:hypothetical protein